MINVLEVFAILKKNVRVILTLQMIEIASKKYGTYRIMKKLLFLRVENYFEAILMMF